MSLPCVSIVNVSEKTLSPRDPCLHWCTAQRLVVHLEQRLLEVEVEKHPVSKSFSHSCRGMSFFPTLNYHCRKQDMKNDAHHGLGRHCSGHWIYNPLHVARKSVLFGRNHIVWNVRRTTARFDERYRTAPSSFVGFASIIRTYLLVYLIYQCIINEKSRNQTYSTWRWRQLPCARFSASSASCRGLLAHDTICKSRCGMDVLLSASFVRLSGPLCRRGIGVPLKSQIREQQRPLCLLSLHTSYYRVN